MSAQSIWPQASADIFSDILNAAVRGDPVLLSWEHGDLRGRLGRSEADGVLVHIRESAPLPPRGAPICLEYPGTDGPCFLYTEVMESLNQTLKARLPPSSRLAERIPEFEN